MSDNPTPAINESLPAEAVRAAAPRLARFLGGTDTGGTDTGGTDTGGAGAPGTTIVVGAGPAIRTDTGGRLLFSGGAGGRPYIPGPLPGWGAIFPRSPAPATAIARTGFPLSGWDPALRAAAMVTDVVKAFDFVANRPANPPEVTAPAGLLADLQALAALWAKPAAERPGLDEIEAQIAGIELYFAKLLACSAEFRQNTHLFIHLALQVGGVVAAHYKLAFNRARPAQAWPAIDPWIPTPRHPSYPSGHALQSYLAAALVGGAVTALQGKLDALADRIARNREWAGVHFKSDTDASMTLSTGVYAAIKTMPWFDGLNRAVADEFKGAVDIGTP